MGFSSKVDITITTKTTTKAMDLNVLLVHEQSQKILTISLKKREGLTKVGSNTM
jgi:hypothetical protein